MRGDVEEMAPDPNVERETSMMREGIWGHTPKAQIWGSFWIAGDGQGLVCVFCFVLNHTTKFY